MDAYCLFVVSWVGVDPVKFVGDRGSKVVHQFVMVSFPAVGAVRIVVDGCHSLRVVQRWVCGLDNVG